VPERVDVREPDRDGNAVPAATAHGAILAKEATRRPPVTVASLRVPDGAT
jgi:hypothetical protein